MDSNQLNMEPIGNECEGENVTAKDHHDLEVPDYYGTWPFICLKRRHPKVECKTRRISVDLEGLSYRYFNA